MQKKYIYISIGFHIVIFLLCVIDIPYLSRKKQFDEQPPIIVDLEDVVISDMTNIPEKAIRAEERKKAERKEKPINEQAAPQIPTHKPDLEIKEEQQNDPIEEEIKINTPTLVEEKPKMEESIEQPAKEKKEPIKEKRKPAPIPQRKPQVKPNPKPEQKKKPDTPVDNQKTPSKQNKAPKTVNPLQSLMNSVDDLQKQIGAEDTPAQVRYDEQVNNLGIEGGNSKGSYFSELSVSGIDFVKTKIQDSWKTVAGGKDDRNIEVIINVKLTKEGQIQSVNIEDMRRYRSDTYFQALADSAERAIYIAQDVHNVFGVLSKQNASSYNDWKEIRFTFTPLGLTR